MDCFNIASDWEKEGYNINRIDGNHLLWTVIPLPGKVCIYVQYIRTLAVCCIYS